MLWTLMAHILQRNSIEEGDDPKDQYDFLLINILLNNIERV